MILQVHSAPQTYGPVPQAHMQDWDCICSGAHDPQSRSCPGAHDLRDCTCPAAHANADFRTHHRFRLCCRGPLVSTRAGSTRAGRPSFAFGAILTQRRWLRGPIEPQLQRQCRLWRLWRYSSGCSKLLQLWERLMSPLMSSSMWMLTTCWMSLRWSRSRCLQYRSFAS